MEPVVSMRNVSHAFGSGALRKQVLHDLSADIYPGEIVILTGPSGSGKTTLLTLAGALRSVQSGTMRIYGKDLSRAAASELVQTRRKIGFIFQSHNLLHSLTAVQNVQMSLALESGLSPAVLRARAVTMLTEVGLAEHADKFPAQLSLGQKQRVAVARALVRRPGLVLADEPTASLDRKSGREIVELLHRLAKEQGCAILLVTHDNRILDMADRMMTLEDGRLSSFAKGLAANAGQMLNNLASMNRRGDLIHKIGELDNQQFVELLEESTSELEQVLRVLDVAQKEVSESMLSQTLEAATFKVGQLLQADRATIFLVDDASQQLHSRIAQHNGQNSLEIVLPITAGIAGHVARTGEALNIAQPYQHPLFNDETDRETGYRTRSILCMPLHNRAKRIFAVAQMLNKKGGASFDATDEARFRELIPPIALLLESCLRLEVPRQMSRS